MYGGAHKSIHHVLHHFNIQSIVLEADPMLCLFSLRNQATLWNIGQEAVVYLDCHPHTLLLPLPEDIRADAIGHDVALRADSEALRSG